MTLRLAICAVRAISFAHPCTIGLPADGTYDPAGAVIKSADAIVRAIAVEYAVPPKDPSIVIIAGTPDSKVRFKVVETLRGKVGSHLILPGRLVEQDDFNDREPPYSFPRPAARSGSCYANSYRAGGQFLLMLKKLPSGEFTVEWFPLGPVNEQLRSEKDKWLLWVRRALVP